MQQIITPKHPLWTRVWLYLQLTYSRVVFWAFPTPEEDYYANIGAIYFNLGKYQKAALLLKKSEQNRGDKDERLGAYNSHILGYCCAVLGNYLESAKYMEKYHSLKEGDVYSISCFGWCLMMLNEYERALEQCLRLSKIEPVSPEIHITCAQILVELERKTEASEQLDWAKMKSQNVAFGEFVVGMKSALDGDLHNAVAQLRRAIKHWPLKPSAESWVAPSYLYQTLAKYLTDLDQPDQAMAALEEAYKKYPRDSSICNSLAIEYADREIRLQQALRLAQKALKTEPENPFFMDTEGWILFKMGLTKQSKSKIEKSLQLHPKSEMAQKHYEEITSSV